MTLSFSSLSGGISFTVITSTGGSKTATLSKTFPAGTYLIESMSGDTNLEIYLGASDGTQVGSATAGAKSVTASAAFLYVTTVNANTDDAVTFTLKSAATLATKTDAVWAPPTITDITPSGLPNINNTTTITGTNFATNVDVKFRKSDDSTLVTPKSTVRGSATSIIATRPDSFAVGDAPYDVIVTNPSTNLSATSLNAITAGAVPVWVTSTTLNPATLNTAFSQTIQATDSDGGSSITYAIVSGALQTGLSLNTSTGVISGTPTGSSGNTTITISATDSGGNAVNRTFTQAILSASAEVEYLLVAGGGTGSTGGTFSAGAGGGAGGYRTNYGGTKLTFTMSDTYTITVGAGGSALSTSGLGNSGNNSSITGTGVSLSATGGGGAGIEGLYGGYNGLYGVGKTGGSGGGSSNSSSNSAPGNAGGYTPVEGYRGGYGINDNGGGGGGSSQAGQDAYGSGQSDGRGGYGGAGTANSITGSSVTYAGGGGGGSYNGLGASGGAGGGTAGASYNGGSSNAGINTGGGSGGTANHGNVNTAGNGGSGIVVLRSNKSATSTTGSPTYTNPSAGVHIYQFLNNGTIIF